MNGISTGVRVGDTSVQQLNKLSNFIQQVGRRVSREALVKEINSNLPIYLQNYYVNNELFEQTSGDISRLFSLGSYRAQLHQWRRQSRAGIGAKSRRRGAKSS